MTTPDDSQTAPPAADTKRGLLIALTAGLALVALGGAAVFATRVVAVPRYAAVALAKLAPTAAAPWSPPAKVYTVPVAEDFTLAVVELSRKCFGSAGCNVSFSIKLTNVGAHEFDPAKSYKIVYTVNGTEDPYSNNLTITGDRYSYDEEELTQVKNKSTTLTATITAIVPA